MPLTQTLLLFAAGMVAGGLNALAGGGGFITLPVLLFSGATPILANTSGTIAVWPGLLASLYAYRRHLKGESHPLKVYIALGAAGSASGAFLLLHTSNTFFMAILPYLMLFATLVFLFGRNVTARLMDFPGGEGGLPKPLLYGLLFLIAVYGGYFGGGMGIMTLAVLALLGMEDMHEMNALKSFLVVVINGVGVAIFVGGGKVDWPRCLAMTCGCVLGGYGAGRLVLALRPERLRMAIAGIAVGMTLYFFLR